jgi:Na+-transporting NADH:ubiquinone oxidoreductase subunit B
MPIPDKIFLKQKPMLLVCYGLSPLLVAAVYLFGWRSLAVAAVVTCAGLITEACFTFPRGKPVTSAVLVTCLIFSLSLPPTIPFWIAVIGIVVGIALGKMAFGGFGKNIFNPAMAGRCFVYVAFPVALTNRWVEPLWGGAAGFKAWAPSVDALSGATPLVQLHEGKVLPWENLFFGNISGSMGETCALLILLGGAYILYKKAASWRLALSCVLGGVILGGLLHLLGFSMIPTPLRTLLSGSFLFGSLFVVTEPVSGPKTKPAQWIYGFFIGALTVVLRGFSNFSEGIMFAVLIMNAFVPLMDHIIRSRKKKAAA